MQNRDWKYLKSRAVLRAALLLFVLGVAGVGIGLLPAPFAPAATVEAAMRRETLTIETQAGRPVFEIEVAESPDDKAKGLMFRAKIPDGTGMLFPYGSPMEITMWMKNTYASLDMVFIRGDGIVHRIETNTEPMSERVIASEGLVTAVLELAAGAAAKFGIKPGDRIIHQAFSAKPN
jgi:uncharacterized protein